MLDVNKRLVLIMVLVIIMVLGIVAGVFTLFDMSVIKWATCNSPFADPQDKTSNLCRELKSVP